MKKLVLSIIFLLGFSTTSYAAGSAGFTVSLADVKSDVRDDIDSNGTTDTTKSLSNDVVFGSIFLGIPLCWVVLIRGCWHETSPFNLALLNFEVTQQGFGMYVKYLMSGFLIIFALSMLFQFSSYIISHINSLDNKKENAVFG